jgi:hypothetical protein
MKRIALLMLALLPLFLTSCVTRGRVDYLPVMAQTRGLPPDRPIVLTDEHKLVTPVRFHPPVEITIVAKTDSTNLRMSYAADQVIFNWERNPTELRVDGGPANGRHKPGAGQIPVNQFVTIKWVVTCSSQSIYVDGRLRYEAMGDYSKIEKPVSVRPALQSIVTVKSVKVRQLPESCCASHE